MARLGFQALVQLYLFHCIVLLLCLIALPLLDSASGLLLDFPLSSYWKLYIALVSFLSIALFARSVRRFNSSLGSTRLLYFLISGLAMLLSIVFGFQLLVILLITFY
jgi:hypothetical protein